MKIGFFDGNNERVKWSVDQLMDRSPLLLVMTYRVFRLEQSTDPIDGSSINRRSVNGVS